MGNVILIAASLTVAVLTHFATTALARDIEPVSTAAFEMPDGAQPAEHSFTGRLSLAAGYAAHYKLLHDGFGTAKDAPGLRTLPSLTIDLVQDGHLVVPAMRTVVRTDHPHWEWIVGAGKSWQAAGADVSVLALPVSLKERNANCIHNGLLTLTRRGEETSRAFFQIGSETCAYLQFDMAALLEAQFEPGRGGADIAVAYRAERAGRLPTRPLADLPFRDELGHPSEVPASTMTALGFLRDGTHYISDCPTRFGDHPFCDDLPLPSYSLAKSLVAGLAAIRLEKLHSGAMNAAVEDYVPACSDGWEGVTFAHLLDMLTGRYGSRAYDRDEAGETMRAFFHAETAAEKTGRACAMFRKRTEPGRVFVYQTTNTYILGVAMDAFLAEQTGRTEADFFAELVVPVYEALGLSPVALETSRTYDDAAQPFAGWGSVLLRDDLAKLMGFLLRGGTIDGEAVLDEGLRTAAMQQNPQDRGAEAVIPEQRYRAGFWAWNAAERLGCDGELFIPLMSGFGGLTAALMPNGDGYYYVSDGGAFRWARAAAASHQSRPMCE